MSALGRLARTVLRARKRARAWLREARRAWSRAHRWGSHCGATVARACRQPGAAVAATLREWGRTWVAFARLSLERLRNRLGAFNLLYGPPGERRTCPACGSRAIRHLDLLWQLRQHAGRSMGFVSGCRRCGLAFANPQPTLEELEAYYAPDSDYVEERWYRGGSTPERTSPDPGRRRPSDERKLRALFEPVAPHLDVVTPPPGARVLDYGCGPGRMLDKLKPWGWQTYGIEPALKTAFARHEELDEPPAEPTFHLVVVHHVLEHLLNPLEVLTSLSASMVEGGAIYISVPRFDAIGRHGDFKYCLNSHGHVVAYTGRCLEALLAMAGLTRCEADNSDALDEALTHGEPMRLRMLARKVSPAPAPPPEPLAEAVQALADYHARFGGYETGDRPWLPARLRAARLSSARQGHVLAHRAQKVREYFRSLDAG